jgi:hypothetical protein
MAETPAFPGPDPTPQAPASEPELGAAEPAIGADTSAGSGDLEAVLTAALDEDDLPDPHPPAPTPTLEAATARPSVESAGAAEADPAPPAPAVPSAPAAGEPTVASTFEVAPLPTGPVGDGARGEGGEFDLLIRKIKAWFEEADLAGQWNRLGGPLRGLGLVLGGLLVLKLYVALLDTLDDVPLLPRLLQLVGLIALLNFSVTRLTRSSDRTVILEDWKRRWDAFRGS